MVQNNIVCILFLCIWIKYRLHSTIVTRRVAGQLCGIWMYSILDNEFLPLVIPLHFLFDVGSKEIVKKNNKCVGILNV